MILLTPLTMHAGLAFLPRYRWEPQLTRARRRCRVKLARELRPIIAERYAREQMDSANSGTEFINRHHRSG